MSLNLADPCFLICGLDCFYTGNVKNYGSCPLNKILSSGYLANPCLCLWTTNFIHWLAVHWISSCPVDNLIQWITLSSILNNRRLSFWYFQNLFLHICSGRIVKGDNWKWHFYKGVFAISAGCDIFSQLINTVGLFYFQLYQWNTKFEVHYLYVCPYTALLQALRVSCLRHLAMLIDGWCTEGI